MTGEIYSSVKTGLVVVANEKPKDHTCKEIITSRQIDGGKWEPKIKETRKENSQGLTRVAAYPCKPSKR